jgi:hypothetical protein
MTRWHFGLLRDGRIIGSWCDNPRAMSITTDRDEVSCKRCLKLLAEVEAMRTAGLVREGTKS